MYARKKSPILEHATANNKLSDSARIRGAQLGAHLQDRFRFSRKIKCVFRFVIVKTLQTEAIIEEHRRAPRSIGEQAVKPAVQSLREIRLHFIPMDQVRRA